MANFITFDNITYCGKEGNEIFQKQLYSLPLANSGITIRDNVKGKEKLYTGTLDDLYQAYTCAFSPSGAADLQEKFIETAPIKVNLEECFDEFWDNYLVEQTRITLNGGIPQSFSDWFFAQLLIKMDREYQEIFYQGDVDYAGATKRYLKVVDGIEKLLKNGAAQKITGAQITVDNVLAQVEAVVMKGIETAAAQEVVTDDYKIFMNYADVKLLEVALGKLCCGAQTIDKFSNYSKTGESFYLFGFEVVPTFCTRSTIIFGPAKNLVLGADTQSSHTEYRVIDMRETTGDNSFRVIAISNIGTQILFDDLFTISYKA